MKGKYLPFLILPMFLFLFSPYVAKAATIRPEEEVKEDWRPSSECNAQCGTVEGTMTETLYEEVCESSCPARTFSGEYMVIDVLGHWGDCPDGYQVSSHLDSMCVGQVVRYADRIGRRCPLLDISYTSTDSSKPCSRTVTDIIGRPWISTTFRSEMFGPIDVNYVLHPGCQGDSFSSDIIPSIQAGCKHVIWIDRFNKGLDKDYVIPDGVEVIVVNDIGQILEL